jgi:hypothetical protein
MIIVCNNYIFCNNSLFLYFCNNSFIPLFFAKNNEPWGLNMGPYEFVSNYFSLL